MKNEKLTMTNGRLQRTKRGERTIILFFALCSLFFCFGCKVKTPAGMGDARLVQQTVAFSGYPMDAGNQTVSWFGAEGYLPNQLNEIGAKIIEKYFQEY